MAKRKTGLGRGLDVLLSAGARDDREDPQALAADDGLYHIPVDQIERGRYQPRVNMDPDALAALADSIRAQGVMQPVLVRPVAGGYELVAGERRWRAAQIAGLQVIPALVREVPDPSAAAMALIENIQREDLNPLEEANALQRLIHEFGMTHQQAAEAVGRSRTSVTNLLRLLELEAPVKALVDEGRLNMGHARALLTLVEDQQVTAARQVVDQDLSVRATERLVQSVQQTPRREAPPPRNPDVARLETELSDRLGARVNIHYNTKGKGRLVIQYNSLDELDGILGHIR
ncbi:chromosome partitioning protein, ParB family [Ectothiorhodospira magna]|uniref:Probable chromosome-partitioning protein ParB n=1 Tax=Ectothiorhodospira magna TaxID=867345 RepID=A0A1H9C4X4_9GAMM|nr:ParB/RepB/Spo0J family partition protein [Ectothiorhodospira magna]SEP96335.1 chromosome partitioning protein, ParB family [Ectothiorhodospira magna]